VKGRNRNNGGRGISKRMNHVGPPGFCEPSRDRRGKCSGGVGQKSKKAGRKNEGGGGEKKKIPLQPERKNWKGISVDNWALKNVGNNHNGRMGSDTSRDKERGKFRKDWYKAKTPGNGEKQISGRRGFYYYCALQKKKIPKNKNNENSSRP